MKTEKTFRATIALGFREGYSSKIYTIELAKAICHEYCDEIGLCVTITPTFFVYSRNLINIFDGEEPGCFIELIQYPRFPYSEENIKNRAITLAKILMKKFNQSKVSVICTDKTYMLELEDII